MADIVQSCGLERATGAVDAALQCVIQMAASPALQARQHLFSRGFLPADIANTVIIHPVQHPTAVTEPCAHACRSSC